MPRVGDKRKRICPACGGLMKKHEWNVDPYEKWRGSPPAIFSCSKCGWSGDSKAMEDILERLKRGRG